MTTVHKVTVIVIHVAIICWFMLDARRHPADIGAIVFAVGIGLIWLLGIIAIMAYLEGRL